MRIQYLFLGLLLLSLVWACNSPNRDVPPQKSAEQNNHEEDSLPALSFETRLEHRIDSQLSLGIRKDTVILGFRFGMTKQQVVRQMQKQLRAGKIIRRKSKGNRFALVYQLPLEAYGKVDTYFDLYYDKGKLSKIDCYPRIPKDASKEELFQACVEVFELKYGATDLQAATGSCPAHYWISANRQIEIACSSEKVVISYFDLSHKKEDLKLEPSINPQDLEI